MSNHKDLRESPQQPTPESDDVPSFTRYKLQRGYGLLKPVRRCSASFSSFSHGKRGAKLVEYISSDDSAEEGTTIYREMRDVFVVPDSPQGSSTNLPKNGVKKEPVVVIEVPSSPGEVTRVFADPPTVRATPGSGSGRKRARSVFSVDFSDWDPDYMSYLRDKYPLDFPPSN